MVECTALEMRRARKGTVGSNPTLSAIYTLSLEFPSGTAWSVAPMLEPPGTAEPAAESVAPGMIEPGKRGPETVVRV